MWLMVFVLTASQGEAIMAHRFKEYQPYKGEITRRSNGSMIALETGTAYAYAIDDIARKRSLTQCKERTLEDIVIAILIIEETEGTATAGGIIDNLGYHLVDIIKEQLVADTVTHC